VTAGGKNVVGRADHGDNSSADARNRALRTFLQGLVLDVLLAVALVVYTAVSAGEVDWRLLAAALVRTVLQTAASYVMRKLKPPPPST